MHVRVYIYKQKRISVKMDDSLNPVGLLSSWNHARPNAFSWISVGDSQTSQSDGMNYLTSKRELYDQPVSQAE